MPFQVTCVCNARFAVEDGQVGQHVTCPTCNRVLVPVAAAAAPPTATGAAPVVTVTAPPPGTPLVKPCPYCGETILAVAKKCKHCGEFITEGADGHAQPAPVFQVSVSQWDNAFKYLICLTVVGLGLLGVIVLKQQWPNHPLREHVPLAFMLLCTVVMFVAYMFFLNNYNAKALIRPTSVVTEVGVISKTVDALDLGRVTSVELQQGFLARLLGIGTVILRSTDENVPVMVLYQIPKARAIFDYLQAQAPLVRQRTAVPPAEKPAGN